MINILLISCNVFSNNDDDDEYGDWEKVSSFEGVPRNNAVSFTINDKAYITTGYDDDENRLRDLWEYDPELDFWQQKADFPGVGRSAAVGFSVNGRGYLGTGFNEDAENDRLKDFWSYDPSNNQWDSLASFGGSARYGAIGFSIGNLGYIGTGNDDNFLKDFWSYDPEEDQWTQIVSIPGEKRIDASVFVIDDKAYVGTGKNNGQFVEDFNMYDPETKAWTRLNDIDENEDDEEISIPRSNAVAFSLNGKGYITLGDRSGNRVDIWEYDPVLDRWNDDLALFEGIARRDAVAFVLGNYAYVGTGIQISSRFDDIWKFNPTILNEEDD